MQSILLYSMVLPRWGRRSTYMRRDAGEEGGREFSSKMPRTMSNLPDFPRRPFLYAHLCLYTKSMVCRLHTYVHFCTYMYSTWLVYLAQEYCTVQYPLLEFYVHYQRIPSDSPACNQNSKKFPGKSL